MNTEIKREAVVHGAGWNAVHEGYFSSPVVAAPLVGIIQELALRSKAKMIADLGGGTGFLLSQLLMAGVEPGVSLVNLDCSAVQLDAAGKTGFTCALGSVDSFSRQEIGPEEERCLYIMRSVLHYFGKAGLRPVLRHLHAQARPGEFFVHQTASFRRRQDADCLNELYRMMRTRKWYPTVDYLCKSLRAEGWRVLDVLPAAPLRLRNDDLGRRYQLDQADILRIRDRLPRSVQVPAEVFTKTDAGFNAFLHYWIYVCIPAIPEGPGPDRQKKAAPSLPAAGEDGG